MLPAAYNVVRLAVGCARLAVLIPPSLAAEQSGSERRCLSGVGDPTRACVQAPPDHGRGRAAPACRGGMGPSVPGSD